MPRPIVQVDFNSIEANGVLVLDNVPIMAAIAELALNDGDEVILIQDPDDIWVRATLHWCAAGYFEAHSDGRCEPFPIRDD